MEEQEDTAPLEGERPKNIPRRIGLFVGAVGLLFVIGAAAMGLRHFGPSLDIGIGLSSASPFVIELDAAGIDAELARLRGLPGETLPTSLGVIAEAKTACIANLMADRPDPKAMAAATRLFVVLFAARKRTESPLIDPRFYEFSTYDAEDMEGLLQLVENGVIRESDIERMVALVQDYGTATHPIYSGLDLDAGGWAYPDFQKIVTVSGANAKRINTCFRARVGG
jgi:hypothetical protein